MSSPYDRLIADDALESINASAELLLRSPETAHEHLVCARTVRALYRHIRAREEIEALWIPAGDQLETEDL